VPIIIGLPKQHILCRSSKQALETAALLSDKEETDNSERVKEHSIIVVEGLITGPANAFNLILQ
jgi:hypothetical protein